MKKLGIFILLAFLLTFFATPVYAAAPPALPHAFYGSVTINGSPAADGTQVSATVDEGVVVTTQNPVTTVGGSYGINSPRLLVQGDIPGGATITFYVNGREATPSQAVTFEAGGGPTLVDMSVTISVPSPPPAPPPAPPPGTTDVRGMVTTAGVFLEPVTATSEDGLCTLTIPEGTVGLTEELEPLDEITVVIMDEPPPPPEEAHVVGFAYDLGPDGATFDPPITLTFSYDPDALPEGVAEEGLVLAYYDEEAGEWVELDGVVDTENNTITASVAHFTTFAIITVPVVAPPAPAPAAFAVSSLGVVPSELAPGEEVNISVLVVNTGGESGSYTVVLKINGVKEAEKSVTVAAGRSQSVSFTVSREDAGSYSVVVDGLSGSFTVVPVVAPPEPATFSVSYLSVSPLGVKPGESVTIAVLVANTGGEVGSYTVVLKIDGVKEAEETVTIAAGESQEVSFSVTREDPGDYTVDVDGLSGGFTVVTVVPPAKRANWPAIGGGIAGGLIVVGLLYYFLVFRRRAY